MLLVSVFDGQYTRSANVSVSIRDANQLILSMSGAGRCVSGYSRVCIDMHRCLCDRTGAIVANRRRIQCRIYRRTLWPIVRVAQVFSIYRRETDAVAGGVHLWQYRLRIARVGLGFLLLVALSV